LGFFYDFLIKFRRPPAIAPGLTLIETGFMPANQNGRSYSGTIIDPAMVSQVVLTLAELDASGLIIQVPILGASLGSAKTEEELQERFYEEFTLLEQNIRNLFQGIRVGSIPPGESEQYVADLVSLTEMGKERLIASFLNRDEAGTALMERSIEAFGKVWQSEDIRIPVIQGKAPPETSENGRQYSRLRPDRDGSFRRIAPVILRMPLGDTEHIAYAALKTRFSRAELETTGVQPKLRLTNAEGERLITLDEQGNILVESPRGGTDFKRVPLSMFLNYERAGEDLYRLLQEAETAGYFAYLDPEDYPPLLYQYSRRLRDEMLEQPSGIVPAAERKDRWLNARKRYLRSVDDYLNGSSETSLITGYEKLLAQERLGDAGVRRLVTMRDDVIGSFMRLRDKYEEFSALRAELSAAVSSSFCVMGPASASPGPAADNGPEVRGFVPALKRILSGPEREPNPTDAEASVILANSILTGRAIVPLADRYVLLWSGGIALIILFLLRKARPCFILIAGLAFILLEGFIFSLGFVFTDYWIDPLQPVLIAATGVFVSFVMAVDLKRREARRFRRAFGACLAPPYLRQVIRVGHPQPGEFIKARAAIVTVRYPSLLTKENRENLKEGSVRIRNFRRTVFNYFTRIGGVFAGIEGDMIMIAFGSPLERAYLNSVKTEAPYEDELHAHSNNSPAAKATGAVMDFAVHTPEAASWYFGIDTGECAFFCVEPSGYTVFGAPLIRSKILASLGIRYKAQILATTAIIEKIDGVISQKLDVLKEKDGEQQAFYKLLTE
jgi:hypothetical protein